MGAVCGWRLRRGDSRPAARQNHAGAFPIDLRRDPMAGLAEIAGRLIDQAHRLGRPALTTAGRCAPFPNTPAMIPRSVAFAGDARRSDPEAATLTHRTDLAILRDVADRRWLGLEVRPASFRPACLSDPALVAALSAAVQGQGAPFLTMASGADHDAQQMAALCPVA